MVTYSTNWMGPINLKWIEEHGDCWSTGRIDIQDDSKWGFDGNREYFIPPMHSEDWNKLDDYLRELKTETLFSYEELIEQFEEHYGKKIRWME